MDLQELLNKYMELLQCSASSLAEASGLPAATLSRYRSGERQPSEGSEQFEKLVSGIVRLAQEKGIDELSEENVRADLHGALGDSEAAKHFAQKLDMLIDMLHINVARMARSMSYDASFLSKIRKGKRLPADMGAFAGQVAAFVASNYADGPSRSILAEILNCQADMLADRETILRQLGGWMISEELPTDNRSSQTFDFLQKLDDFSLDDYIRAIRFDELKVPTVPFQFPASKAFRGMEGQKKAEIEFLKGVVLSRSREPLFMYADMDMADMSEDKDFSKKWLLGLAMILKKEQPIVLIHNLNRPFHELMLGLEAYIPLYMTGLVSPYYFPGGHNAVFNHLLYVSETYALNGEGVADHHEQSRFFLSNNKEEVAYCRERARLLLAKARPLMDIYTVENREQFEAFWEKMYHEPGDRHFISSVLPVFTLPQPKLEEILDRGGISEADKKAMLACAARQREIMEYLLQNNIVMDELPLINREEYAAHPMTLCFAEAFCPPAPYSYEDYVEHLAYTKEYAAAHPSYKIQFRQDFGFRNIRIDILQGKKVWISKVTSPAIHFIIYQEQLREAIEKMYVAMTD